jgi:predicted nucleic acid-binding protein
VILIDTSAWVEFLRGTSSPICEEVDRLLDADIVIADPIAMEVLAGARDEVHLHQLQGLLTRAHLEHCRPPDFPTAALLYRQCRQAGETVRRLIDCVIAAIALRTDAAVLHDDRDFDVLARHTGLKVHRPRGKAPV